MATRSRLRNALPVVALAASAACGTSSGSGAVDAAAGDVHARDAGDGATRDGHARDTSAASMGSTATDGGAVAPDATVDAPSRHDAHPTDDARADVHPGDASDAKGSRDAADATADAEGGTCTGHASPGPADATRRVVISHPFSNSMSASSDFEVLDLSSAGEITPRAAHAHFKLGPTSFGTVVFTPDGAVGLVAEDDGTLGVFRLDPDGTPHVVSASLAGSYYADSLLMDPSGTRAYVLDDQTAGNGGGIYVVDIACDGTLTDRGLLAGAQLPAAVFPLPDGHAVVATKQFLGVPDIYDAGPSDAADAAVTLPDGAVSGNDAVLVPWPAATSALGWANPFGDDQAIVGGAALTADGAFVLLGDTSAFSTVPNRVGVVRVGATGLTSAGFVPNVNDPQAIVASPFDNTILVASGFGNALFVLVPGHEAGAAPFELGGPVTYVGAAPQLPGPAVLVDRGALKGRVLVTEDLGVRQVQFNATGGGVTDLGLTTTGNASDLTSIPGAIGVTP